MSATLSKKQQKALAFRAKQKAKKGEEIEDVPEADLDEEEEEAVAPVPESTREKGKKRKREVVEGEEEKKEEAKEDEVKEPQPKKKKTKEAKQRFILFLGNLGFKTTRESVAQHFKEAAGHIPSVRLLTEKASGSQPPKSRGIAFLEVLSSEEMQKCLKLHHSILNGRQINVELTAGGGGKSAARKGKIAERNERVGVQRERRKEKEKAEGGGDEEQVAVGGDNWADKAKPDDDVNGYKVRGGRRVKAKPGKDDKKGGWDKPGNSGQPRKFAKWQPTGANALSVG